MKDEKNNAVADENRLVWTKLKSAKDSAQKIQSGMIEEKYVQMNNKRQTKKKSTNKQNKKRRKEDSHNADQRLLWT